MLVASTSLPLTTGLAPAFQGRRTTIQSRQELLSCAELGCLLEKDTDPYLGEIPVAFKRWEHREDIDFFQGLDWLAHQLVTPSRPSLKERFGFPLHNPIKKMLKSGALKYEYVGEGKTGTVYRLDLDGQSFAFKIFGEWLKAFHPFREAATGLYFSAQPTKDLSMLYAANPREKWTLMEYVPSTASLGVRAGKTLFEQGYKLSDEHAKNRINGIRVDHGGWVSDLNGGYIAGDRFTKSQWIRSDQHRPFTKGKSLLPDGRDTVSL